MQKKKTGMNFVRGKKTEQKQNQKRVANKDRKKKQCKMW